MRNRNRKDKPGFLDKRGGSSSGGGGGGSSGGDEADPPEKTLPAQMDLLDVFDDLEVIAPNMKVQDAQNLIRQALNIESRAEIPEVLTSAQAAKIVRLLAVRTKFNIKRSELKHYLNY